MLTHLSIRNIVLIEACDIALSPGLCVLTGETGAGKSILLDALGLALGARGDAALIRRGESTGNVMAEFDIRANPAAQTALAEMEVAQEGELIIRRTITFDGKTRALVNDQPVSVSALKKLGETLVEIHGQHDQRGLMDPSTHRPMLDAFGRHEALLKETQAHGQAWKQARASLEQLQAEIAQAEREVEFLRYTASELRQLDPRPGEEEELATQRSTMMQGEKLHEMLHQALQELSTGKGVSGTLRSAQRMLMRSLLNTAERCAPIVETLDRAANEADEAVVLLERVSAESLYNPARLESIEERLFALKAAARKYHTSADGLMALKDQTEARLALAESRDGELPKRRQAEAAAKAAFLEAASRLTKQREKAAKRLCQAVEAELEPLKLGHARFRVRIDPLPESSWSGSGADVVTFEAATNVSKKSDIVYAPLARIASGGELSRFMLAAKVALSAVYSTPTLIFDEIDAGTGGAVADAIGQRLSRLGESAQVLVVTHLPQVAARGSEHLQVLKTEAKGRVLTRVVELSAEERQEEVARMLAGSRVTPEARRAARKLLEEAA